METKTTEMKLSELAVQSTSTDVMGKIGVDIAAVLTEMLISVNALCVHLLISACLWVCQ